VEEIPRPSCLKDIPKPGCQKTIFKKPGWSGTADGKNGKKRVKKNKDIKAMGRLAFCQVGQGELRIQYKREGNSKELIRGVGVTKPRRTRAGASGAQP